MCIVSGSIFQGWPAALLYACLRVCLLHWHAFLRCACALSTANIGLPVSQHWRRHQLPFAQAAPLHRGAAPQCHPQLPIMPCEPAQRLGTAVFTVLAVRQLLAPAAAHAAGFSELPRVTAAACSGSSWEDFTLVRVASVLAPFNTLTLEECEHYMSSANARNSFSPLFTTPLRPLARCQNPRAGLMRASATELSHRTVPSGASYPVSVGVPRWRRARCQRADEKSAHTQLRSQLLQLAGAP